MPKPVASLLARVSKRADENNLSLDGMVSEMIDFCRKNGWEPRYIHREDGLSGGKRDRKDFKEWVLDATEGRAQILVNPHTDRLTREGLNVAARLLDVVEGKDPITGRQVSLPVRLVDLQGLDSEHGDSFRFRFVIQAEVARAERERIRARAKASYRRLIKAGRARGTFPPYGYRIIDAPDGKGKTYEINKEEAAFIKEAYRRIIDNQPVGRVTRWANDQGYKPRIAERWSRTGLRKTLLSSHLLGRVTSKGKLVRTDEGEPFQPFPAILTLAEHAALAEKLAVKSPRDQPPKRLAHLLSGLLYCHCCGKNLTAVMSKGVPRYRCQTRSSGGDCSGSVSCSRELADAALEDLFLSRYGAERMYRTRVITEGVDDLAEINEDIREVMSELSGEVTPEAVERLQRLQKKRAEAEAHPPTVRRVKEPTGESVALWWESAHMDDKRDALRNAFGRITLHPGKRGAHGFDVSRLTFERSQEEE